MRNLERANCVKCQYQAWWKFLYPPKNNHWIVASKQSTCCYFITGRITARPAASKSRVLLAWFFVLSSPLFSSLTKRTTEWEKEREREDEKKNERERERERTFFSVLPGKLVWPRPTDFVILLLVHAALLSLFDRLHACDCSLTQLLHFVLRLIYSPFSAHFVRLQMKINPINEKVNGTNSTVHWNYSKAKQLIIISRCYHMKQNHVTLLIVKLKSMLQNLIN